MRLEPPTAKGLKFVLMLIFGLISLVASGQPSVNDSVLYDLTSRTIGSNRKLNSKKLRILKFVTVPVEVWDKEKRMPRTGAYLSPNDLESIANQIQYPAIKTWDRDIITKKANIKLVAKIHKRECLVISLPIVSADGQKIVIYYQSVSKYSGAGFVTVWRRANLGTWIKEEEAMLWITKLKAKLCADYS